MHEVADEVSVSLSHQSGEKSPGMLSASTNSHFHLRIPFGKSA